MSAADLILIALCALAAAGLLLEDRRHARELEREQGFRQ